MKPLLICAWLATASATIDATVTDATPYFGQYQPWSRGCSGAAQLRAKTIEWRTTWSHCKPSSYAIVGIAPRNEPPYIAVRLNARSKGCDFEVIELKEQQIGDNPKMWSITGYPSMEAYQNRALPEWKNATSDERMPLSCPLEPRIDPRR